MLSRCRRCTTTTKTFATLPLATSTFPTTSVTTSVASTCAAAFTSTLTTTAHASPLRAISLWHVR